LTTDNLRLGYGGRKPELVFGLIGAVGTDLRAVETELTQRLTEVGYGVSSIRISELMADCHRFSSLKDLQEAGEDERINKYMDAGDWLRREAKRGDIMALFAMAKIREIRQKAGGRPDQPIDAKAYILRSLKHPNEIETLRDVYGDAFFAVSVYSPKQDRLKQLKNTIARSHNNFSDYTEATEKLMERDEKELEDDLGQSVRDAFPEGDVFIDFSDKPAEQLTRFADLLFGHPFITPRMDEYGMFHAWSSALRSADLSRQVGAVIASDDGEIIVAGCNEVPMAGGGAFWDGDADRRLRDGRDFTIGWDSAASMKHKILQEIFEKLASNGWLSAEKAATRIEDLITEALFEGEAPPLKGTRVASIIEFGRIVHAEMSAITQAARRGLSVKDATLYCTTFPCHMCARHIVAAGIKRVVYIEPYPKSMAKELYENIIVVDRETQQIDPVVHFESFKGVAPRKYFEMFEMVKRKDRVGRVVEWKRGGAIPRIRQHANYTELETIRVAFLNESAELLGIVPPTIGES
jgi:deoxycytidylate deaminase